MPTAITQVIGQTDFTFRTAHAVACLTGVVRLCYQWSIGPITAASAHDYSYDDSDKMNSRRSQTDSIKGIDSGQTYSKKNYWFYKTHKWTDHRLSYMYWATCSVLHQFAWYLEWFCENVVTSKHSSTLSFFLSLSLSAANQSDEDIEM